MQCSLVALMACAFAAATLAAGQEFVAVPVCAVSGAACSDSLACCASESYECRPITGRPDGRFCLPRDEVCYVLGGACDGAKPCCGEDDEDANVACKPWEGDPEGEQETGSFCQKEFYEEYERCRGVAGFPFVVWRPCAEGLVCRSIKGGLWGQFCAPPLSDEE